MQQRLLATLDGSEIELLNIFDLPTDLPQDEEQLDVLLEDGEQKIRIERIVSTGQASPAGFWYDQTQNEWVLLLQGQAELAWEDGRVIPLKKGDWVFIPAHKRHRIIWTSDEPPCIWLAVHYGD
jgi:cupin 2 domain-containing protein